MLHLFPLVNDEARFRASAPSIPLSVQVHLRLAGTKRFIAFYLVLVDLNTLHQLQKQLSVNRPFRVTISCHVSSVTPLDCLDHPVLKLLAYPTHMTK